MCGLFKLCRSPNPLPLSRRKQISTRDTPEACSRPGMGTSRRDCPPPHAEGMVFGRMRCSQGRNIRFPKEKGAERRRLLIMSSGVQTAHSKRCFQEPDFSRNRASIQVLPQRPFSQGKNSSGQRIHFSVTWALEGLLSLPLDSSLCDLEVS